MSVQSKTTGLHFLKELLLFLTLFSLVFLINFPVVAFDMMYPEQPLIYIANQELHSWKDLLSVYLHPKMFHISILFFRPSGHFLMYQLLAPLLGWHNTRGFIIVNLVFLALTAYVLLKLYKLLFPKYKLGAYIAMGVYLMHPALMLSRLIVLHFEFAYVFFTLFSLYCFVLFCQKGLHNARLLALALFLFLVAVSFKEPALFLGPVLFCYLLFYSGSRAFARNEAGRKIRQIGLLIFILSLCLMFYLSLQWPTFRHPLRSDVQFSVILAALKRLSLNIIGLQDQLFPPPLWRNVLYTPMASGLLWVLSLISVMGSVSLYANKDGLRSSYGKPLAFLYVASLLFLILPVGWGWGLPWHLSLTLLFLSMIMGFCCEYLGSLLVKNSVILTTLTVILGLVLGLIGFQVNQRNIDYLSSEQGLPLTAGRNAVLHPPVLRNLNSQSVLVVEDSILHDAYLLGASIYPYYFSFKLNSPNLNASEKQYEQAKKWMFVRQQPVYNGTLFRWAYLIPELREEVYPFQVENMQQVPNLILYEWLRQADNIFCLGYDEQGNWHDRSELFKKNLSLEKERRHLIVNAYEEIPVTAYEGRVMATHPLPFPEPQLCQLECDQNQACKGFTYVNLEKADQNLNECLFYGALSQRDQQFCAACVSYVKRL